MIKPPVEPADLKDVNLVDFLKYYQSTYLNINGKVSLVYSQSNVAHNSVMLRTITAATGAYKDEHVSLESLLNWDVLKYPELGWVKAPGRLGALGFFTKKEGPTRKGLRLEGLRLFRPLCMESDKLDFFKESDYDGTHQSSKAWCIFNRTFEKGKTAIEAMLSGKSVGAVLSPKMALIPNNSKTRPICLYFGTEIVGEYGPDVGWRFTNEKVEKAYRRLEN